MLCALLYYCSNGVTTSTKGFSTPKSKSLVHLPPVIAFDLNSVVEERATLRLWNIYFILITSFLHQHHLPPPLFLFFVEGAQQQDEDDVNFRPHHVSDMHFSPPHSSLKGNAHKKYPKKENLSCGCFHSRIRSLGFQKKTPIVITSDVQSTLSTLRNF